ncbi:terminase TerL endonuclease subunit [Escherichia coli]
MSRKSYPNVNAANQYARDVVRGKIVACQFVIQACQRHLDDLMEEKSKSFRYRFDKDLAERAAKFIQLLPHTKGEWAFKRMPITLEPWQLFVICCAFGWVNKGTRLRRFREVYTEIPRKNGKSAISAGVALYCFACDNEFGAEVYSGATTEKQAWEVFRPARLMCKRTPMLTEAFGIEVNASNMNRPEDGARFEPLIGNPGDGSSPHCAVVDEYHEHATDALYTTMLTGMGARRQPLMWAITTAGYNIEGPCYDKRREVIEMLNGSVPNDELFGIIYTVDEGDDWTDPQVLEKANPNIGVSVYREFLLSQQQRAKNNARLANVFKTKHLNIWVSARSAYFNLVSWQSCENKSLTLEQFEGQPCILAFDLARKLDMNSMARLYTREIDGKTHYYSVAPRFWVPYDTVYSVEKNEDRRTAERFQKWVEMGVLTVTDGAEVDYRYILEEAKAANKISPVSESPIDPFGATGLSHDLADEDLNPITIIQNYTNMSDPMKELEAAIESGRFHHDGNPIMTWCIGNVVGKTIPGNDDVVKPVKEQAENKIDGAVALIMAVVRENPELVKTIAKIGLALLTVGAAAGSLSRIMKVLGGVMNMTPAKGLIALLVGGAYLIIDNWETVGPVIKKVWHVVDETAQVMGGWETVLKAIALFMATKWVADVTKSITAVTREMRTLGKVSAETGLMGKGRGFIGKAGVYGFLGTLMYEPVKDTLESVVPEDTVNWLDNKGLFLASDWTPFFDRKEYEQYQASLSQYKPNVPLLNPSSSMTQHSELKVTFENAPPGMKIIDVPGKADPLMKITHDVGYSPFRFPR